MTRPRLTGSMICALLVAAFAVPANANPEPAMRTVTDPNGRYTIKFPQSWEIVSMNAKPVAGEIVNQLGKNFFSMLMAVEPAAPSAAPTMLMVMGMELPVAISPRTFGLMTKESMGDKFKQFTIVQEGTATIAKRPAFYRYFTMQDRDGDEYYGVMAFFTVGKTGYVVFGFTQNNPATVRESFGEVSRVLETFHPTGK
jgi:hypothetical protein